MRSVKSTIERYKKACADSSNNGSVSEANAQEAASLGIVPCVSFKESPITMDAKQLQIHIAEVYFLTILKGLKHRLAAGAKLPNVTILLPVEKAQVITLEGEKTINVAGRISQAVASLLRRLGLPYQGNESYGKIRINGISLRRWLQPKLDSPFSGKPGEWSTSLSRLGKRNKLPATQYSHW
ncbi:hypothetical protein H0E87_008130 [Populus deltoides]|uniref:Uncharacterized protein n=1 Tax=Populus deltoides TaxID=3696 RepID=A0A8T2YZI6_POPDE|nr:hypothetical protein H0E87_008130 [Populus deltoides]